jgi:protoporphyrinogen oxidase
VSTATPLRGHESQAPRVAVVGAGLLGLSAAYRLAQAGMSVTVYERDAELGGLAGTTPLAGIPIDRFYHVTLPTDERVIELAEELGLGDRFRRSGVGFYRQSRLASMSTPRELLAFPGLSPVDRMRLVAFVARCQVGTDYSRLEETPIEAWLVRLCGRRTCGRCSGARCSTRSSTAVIRNCRPRTCGRARAGCRARATSPRRR